MRKRRLAASAAVAALISSVLTLTAAVGPAGATTTEPVLSVPVSFAVQNVNRTPVLCGSDGKNYTVRGHIITTRSALAKHDAATLYLHAVTLGEYYWNLQSPGGYDYADQQARNGHTSVIIDRLGYGASDHPDGWATCFGSEADVAHQILGQLRSGKYQSASAAAFSHVYSAGSSVGGLIANLEAATFHDVDGVINFSWGDFVATPFTAVGLTKVLAQCTLGGGKGTPGYAAIFGDARDQFYFQSAEDSVRAAVPALHADPCGQLASLPTAITADILHLSDINVPVLVMFGGSDTVFAPQPLAAQQEALRYLGSPKVTSATIAGASHFPLFETNHMTVVDDVNNWLNAQKH